MKEKIALAKALKLGIRLFWQDVKRERRFGNSKTYSEATARVWKLYQMKGRYRSGDYQ